MYNAPNSPTQLYANVIAPLFSAVNVPYKLGIYISRLLFIPDASRFKAQSVSRLLQFSINDALMARSARVMQPKQLDILPTQSKDNGASLTDKLD